MAKFDNLKDAEKYYTEKYMPASAAKRLAAWKAANPSTAPAKKVEMEVEDKADEE